MKSKKETKSKPAPLVEWHGCNGFIKGTKVFWMMDYLAGIILVFQTNAGELLELESYCDKKTARRGAERFARRMRRLFAEPGKGAEK